MPPIELLVSKMFFDVDIDAKYLIESLFPFIISTAHASSALSTNRIDLINEHNAGGLLLALAELSGQSDQSQFLSIVSHSHQSKQGISQKDPKVAWLCMILVFKAKKSGGCKGRNGHMQNRFQLSN